MPPTIGNVHIDVLLTNVASGTKNAGYIADQALNVIPVAKESGKIGVFGTEHYRLDFNPRGIGGDAARIDWAANTPIQFNAAEYTLEMPVDDRQLALYDAPFRAYEVASMTIAEKLRLKREDVVGSLMTTSGNFGSTGAAAAVWSTPASATPVTDIRKGVAAIVAKTGMSPANIVLVISYGMFNSLVQAPEVKNLYLNTVGGAAGPGPLMMNNQDLANAFGIGGIYVSTAVKNTAKEGATDAFSYCFGTTTAALIAKSPNPSLENPGWGAILAPTVPGLGGADVVIDQYREERKESNIVRGRLMFASLKITANAGYIITGC